MPDDIQAIVDKLEDIKTQFEQVMADLTALGLNRTVISHAVSADKCAPFIDPPTQALGCFLSIPVKDPPIKVSDVKNYVSLNRQCIVDLLEVLYDIGGS